MAALDDVVSGHSPSHLASRELHVLAVDDSLVDRTVVERLLKISSCRVTAVESGTRALQYLGLDEEKSSVQFDDMKVNLIMTDYSMPGMTGYELLKKIKESKAFKEVPVVIMSSENVLAQIDRCLEEGAEDYIVKPVKLSDVRRLKDFLLKGDTEENGEKGAEDYIVKPVKLSDVRRLKDFLLKGDTEENGEKEAQQQQEENTSLTSPSQPTKVSPIIAFTTSSLLRSSSETLTKWPRLFCNVD